MALALNQACHAAASLLLTFALLSFCRQGCREGFPLSDFFSSSTAKGSIFGDGSLDWEAYTAWCKDLYALHDVPKPPSSLVYDEDTYSSATNIVVSGLDSVFQQCPECREGMLCCIDSAPTTSNLNALVTRG